MTNEEIFQVLRPHIERVSGREQVILANQNKNSPIGEYASVQIRTDVGERGQANIIKRNVPGNLVQDEVRSQQVVTCVTEFYRGDAQEDAAKLLQMGRRQDVVWDLFKHKMSIRNIGRVMDLTALQSSNFEQRARVEIYLWMEGVGTYEVNNILAVEVQVQNEQGDILQEIDVTELNA